MLGACKFPVQITNLKLLKECQAIPLETQTRHAAEKNDKNRFMTKDDDVGGYHLDKDPTLQEVGGYHLDKDPTLQEVGGYHLDKAPTLQQDVGGDHLDNNTFPPYKRLVAITLTRFPPYKRL